jgi:hypothetical protein
VRLSRLSCIYISACAARKGDEEEEMTKAEVERAIASDPDEAGMVVDWKTATVDRASRGRRRA